MVSLAAISRRSATWRLASVTSSELIKVRAAQRISSLKKLFLDIADELSPRLNVNAPFRANPKRSAKNLDVEFEIQGESDNFMSK